MKKHIIVGMLVLCGAFVLAGCKHEHVWEEATCETAKYCTECEATEGEALGHVWEEATCTLPKTCKTCGATEGVRAGHKFLDATCDKPKECEVCGETKGEPLVHNGRRVGRCKLCGEVQNKELVTEIGARYETVYSDYVAMMTALLQEATEMTEELNTLPDLNAETDSETVFIGGHSIGTITVGEYLEWADDWMRKLYWEGKMENYTEWKGLYEEVYSMCGDYTELRALKETTKEIVDLIPQEMPEKKDWTGGIYDVLGKAISEGMKEQMDEEMEQWKADCLKGIEWLGKVEKKMGEWKKEYDKVNVLFK